MTKKIAILLLPFVLASCEGLSSKKTKHIIDLTPKLSVGNQEPINLKYSDQYYKSVDWDMSKVKSYNLTKHKIIANPVFVDDVIYVLDSTSLVTAFSRRSNTILWHYNVASKYSKHSCINGGIEYNNGRLYVTNGSRFLTVLDSDSGHEIFRKEFSDVINVKPVMLNSHTILVQTVSNHLFAFDLNNAALIWQHEGLFETLSSSYHVSPVVHDGQVIVNYSSGQIFSLDVNTGQEKWVFNLSSHKSITLPSFEPSSVVCSPIIRANNIYLASSLGKLMKLDIKTGLTIWEINANDIQSMAIYGDNLFVTNNARQIGVINTDNGNIKFVADLQKKKKKESASFLPPLITKNGTQLILNIIARNGEVYKFHLDDKGYLVVEDSAFFLKQKIEYWGAILSKVGAESGEIYFTTDTKLIDLPGNVH
jgi:outer membrane protein assembly factor BamB